jgi:hypothetical protein
MTHSDAPAGTPDVAGLEPVGERGNQQPVVVAHVVDERLPGTAVGSEGGEDADGVGVEELAKLGGQGTHAVSGSLSGAR